MFHGTFDHLNFEHKVGEDATIVQNPHYMVKHILQSIRISCLNFMNKVEETHLKNESCHDA